MLSAELGHNSPVEARPVGAVPVVWQSVPAVPAVHAGGELPALNVLVVAIASAVLTLVPLSVIEEFAGAVAAPPHLTRTFAVPAGDTVSWVAELP